MRLVDAVHVVLAIVLLGASLLNWRLVRHRPMWQRIASSAVLFALLTTFVVATIGSPLEPMLIAAPGGGRLWQQLVVSAWWLLAARFLVELSRATVLTQSFAGEGRLFSDLLAGLLYLTVLLTIVSTVFGFPIGGLVATSGVIAIVLGLALQNTLADVFAGLAVGIERPYAVGDLIWLEGPVEGEVVQINWRSVQVRTAGNDIATVPNSLVAKSRIINRSVPSTRRRDSIQLPCDATVMPERVIEPIQWAILLCPTILETPPPSVSLVQIGTTSHVYEVSFSVSHSNVLGQTKSNLLTAIVRQFRAAGIATASPVEPDAAHAPDPAEAGRDLSALPLFEDLPGDIRQSLERQLIRRRLEPGDILFAEGGTEASLYIIVTGVVTVFRMVDQRPLHMGRLSSGAYIGEIGMLTGAPHAASVQALTRCNVLELRKEHVAPLFAAQPSMLRAFEISARRGQALIDRSVAASVGEQAIPAAQLLDRMRAFFHIH